MTFDFKTIIKTFDFFPTEKLLFYFSPDGADILQKSPRAMEIKAIAGQNGF